MLESALRAERAGRFQAAAGLYEQFLKLPGGNSFGSYRELAVVLNRLGKIYYEHLGMPLRAMEVWKHGLTISETHGDSALVLLFSYNAGIASLCTARYADADLFFQKAESLASTMGEQTFLYKVYQAHAALYEQQGDTAKAEEILERLSLLPGAGRPVDLAIRSLLRRADSAVVSDAKGIAFSLLDSAIALAQQKGAREYVLALWSKGTALQHFQAWDSALMAFRSGYQVASQVQITSGMADCASGVGSVFYNMGRVDSALHYLKIAVDLHSQIQNSEALASDYYNLGLLLQLAGKGIEAANALERSVALFEAVRSQVADVFTHERRRMYLAERSNAYEQLLAALQALGRTDEVFEVLELQQARTLYETLLGLAVEQEEFEGVPFDTVVVYAPSGSDALRVAYKLAQGVSMEEIRHDLLDKESALIEYFVGSAHSYAFVLTRDRATVVELVPPYEIWRMVKAVRAVVQFRSIPDVVSALGRLSVALVDPIWKEFQGKRRLFIIPSGPLWLIPFEALLCGGEARQSFSADSFQRVDFLVKRFSITYGPSAAVLMHSLARTEPSGGSLLSFIGVADPSRPYSIKSHKAEISLGTERDSVLAALPFAREEVKQIAALFPSEQTLVLVGDEASETHVKKVLGERPAKIIHFATHGFLSRSGTEQVGLLLNPSAEDDGILQSNEVTHFHMNTDLVVLSACHSGLGTIIAGEGIMGFARAFMLAGARSVVTTLWSVPDRSTSMLMKRFYGEYVESQAKLPEALQKAKLWLLESGDYAAPYFWAPFIAIGF
ncbi:MAG: CHAT domain-containing protein [Bacteroidota bacterium]